MCLEQVRRRETSARRDARTAKELRRVTTDSCQWCTFTGNDAVHGDDEVDRKALEDAVVDAGSGRGGMYAVGSRWHEGTMMAMLQKSENRIRDAQERADEASRDRR